MNERVVVRPAESGDGAACADLWVEFGRALAERDDGFREPIRIGLDGWFEEQIVATPPTVLRVLAFDGERAVGLAQAILALPGSNPGAALRDDMTEPRVKLEDLVVAEGFRDRGIGASLLEHVLSWGREHGATSALLSSDPEGAPRRFYERHGFEIIAATYGKRLD